MHVAHGNNDAPPLFIFGDSTFDVGTNNVLRSGARANFPYNGIDFYHSLPTGRFSNGFNTADQIGKYYLTINMTTLSIITNVFPAFFLFCGN